MARDVTLIPANPHTVTRGGRVQERETLRVAAYCRVSTNNEDQLLSFDNQVQYYTEYIANKPNYTMAGIYADEGISGLDARKRDEFNRMLADCRAGKIDRILVKSVSRFSRNIMESLETVRMLKASGVSVIFEMEGIDTRMESGELHVAVFHELARMESESLEKSHGCPCRYRCIHVAHRKE